MVNYNLLTTSEIDGLLMMNYQPKRKEKVSLSDRSHFEFHILTRIRMTALQEEFGKNILFFLDKNNEFKKPKTAYEVFAADMHIFKMAALKTYHEFTEILRL